jgi:hypothetical protein
MESKETRDPNQMRRPEKGPSLKGHGVSILDRPFKPAASGSPSAIERVPIIRQSSNYSDRTERTGLTSESHVDSSVFSGQNEDDCFLEEENIFHAFEEVSLLEDNLAYPPLHTANDPAGPLPSILVLSPSTTPALAIKV